MHNFEEKHRRSFMSFVVYKKNNYFGKKNTAMRIKLKRKKKKKKN